MIASWMLYAALVGALMTVVAVALDRVAVARQRPTRMIWFAALLLSVAWPVGRAAARLAPERTHGVRLIPFSITVQSPAITSRASGLSRDAIDRGLVVLWFGLSAFLFMRLTRGVITLRRTSSTWKPTEIDGRPVRLSSNVGPAVIGLRSMDVVLPEWILSLDESLRAIVLRHEEEHRSARDPYLLFGAALAVALMPWNLALWFQAKRLRLAIELDCDARVLRAHPSTERYGLLMLTIAQRRSVAPTLFAPMLTEPTTQLERRIIAMRTTTGRLARGTVYGGSVIALGVLAFACSLQSDNATGPKPSGRPQRVTDNQNFFEFQVEKTAKLVDGNPSPRYPDLLRSAKISGGVVAQFVVDTTGVPDMRTFKVLKSSHELFMASVRETVPSLRFSPAEVGGRKVKQLVEMPFEFSLSREAEQPGVTFSARQVSPPNVSPGGLRKPDTKLPPGVYFEYQVQKAVSPAAGNRAPRYPDLLRSAKIEGQVLAQFIVDENGIADSTSITVLRSTHDLFTNAVLSTIGSFRFNPAELGGRRVKQLVQMPFQFSLSK
ncbi:MAG TPA: M56 family metallopeptidase [Gemmatimonadaceae bacterium]|jgi:TonB family protein|nr:M56 family metallopeptidase [Gemmatimonadaceae bacterium]